MASERNLTEEQVEELQAAMYKVKASSNEIEVKEAAKVILSHHMDVGGVRKILSVMHTGIIESTDSSVDQERAVDLAQKSFLNIISELFVNAFRMGMLEQQSEYRKLIQDIQDKKPQETIGDPAPEDIEKKEAE